MSDVVPFEPRPLGQPGGFAQRPGTPEGYPEIRNEGLSFRDYLALFRRQIWIILASVAVFSGAAAYLVFTADPVYRAEAVVRLADSRRQMTGEGAANPWEGVLGRETDVLLSQIQVMMSRQVAANVVDREGLRLRPLAGEPYVPEIQRIAVTGDAQGDTVRFTFEAGGVRIDHRGQQARAAYGQPVSVAGASFVVGSRPRVPSTSYTIVSRNSAVTTLRKSLQANVRPKTDVIDLHFTSTSPQLSQRVVNAVAQTFQEYNAETAQQASRRRRIFLEEQLSQTDAMLKRAMGDYSAYRAGQQVFSSREKASAQQAGIVDVDIRRADLAAQKRVYESLLAQSQRGTGAEAGLRALVSSPGIAANPVIQQLYAQLTRYEEGRDSLVSAGAAPTNPDVIAVTTLVNTTTGRLMAAVRNQIQSLDAQIAALDDLRARSTAEIVSAPRAETEEARLAQQVQTVQKMADQLQEEHQRAKMAEAVEAGQVDIVDLAELPDRPLSAGRIRRLALGVIIGLLIGLGGAILRDGMNTSIRRRDDVERILQIPGLAVIPRFMNAGPTGRFARALPALAKNGNGNGHGSNRIAGLVTIHDAGSSEAEAYKTLRTNLIFSQAVQTLRSIVVTSAAPGEGKTTTAANLAVSFAQQGMRVLIVDCDLRRSRLHKMFGVPREPGVTECVLGITDTETAPLETSVTGLYVLPSGQLPPNPSELLGGERMRKTLAALGEAFDLIVLDTPPLLAASDAAILSTIADGVVLVVRAGVTEAEAGQQALQQLSAVGARVVGAVLNDPDAKVHKYGGYYKYDYAGK